ncbi:MAG: hypothetical protein Ta2G_06660 [Termitinemataceae bacterium]|nr:MAG: hypothetical protein Ta2G_06660 [Termitinemataceae bacterium]
MAGTHKNNTKEFEELTYAEQAKSINVEMIHNGNIKMVDRVFRDKVSFGKRIEYYVIGNMLKEGLDVFLPMIDDDAIDAAVKVKRPKGNYEYVEIQIKAHSNDVVLGQSGLFGGISHESRRNYWFIFYSERLNKMWILSSKEFIKEADQNKNGKNKGKYNLCFTGKNTKNKTEHIKPQFEKYVANDFSRILIADPNEA